MIIMVQTLGDLVFRLYLLLWIHFQNTPFTFEDAIALLDTETTAGYLRQALYQMTNRGWAHTISKHPEKDWRVKAYCLYSFEEIITSFKKENKITSSETS